MEKHYVFKSLFEDNITQVSSIGGKADDYAEMHVPLGTHCLVSIQFEGDQEASCWQWMSLVLNCVTQFNIVWHVGTFPFLPMSKYRRKTRCITVPESLFLKNVSTANARCSSDQRCMMTEGFKPLFPAMWVSPCHLQKCRHGAKFKSSNCFCPTVYERHIQTAVLWHETMEGCSSTVGIKINLFYFRHQTTRRWRSGSCCNATSAAQHLTPGSTLLWLSGNCQHGSSGIDTAVSAHGEIIPLRCLNTESCDNKSKWQLMARGRDKRGKDRLRQLYDWAKQLCHDCDSEVCVRRYKRTKLESTSQLTHQKRLFSHATKTASCCSGNKKIQRISRSFVVVRR